MQDHDAVVRQEVLRLAEEFAVVGGAHMLEHPDGDDPVEGARLFAVIPEVEAHALAQARSRRALLRKLVLLGGKCDAGRVHAGDAGQIEGEAAPAAADIQQFLTRGQQQLGGKMQLLVRLGGFQVVVVAGEIGAAVLAVLVEKQVIKGAREVVVMGDIAACPRDWVVAVYHAGKSAELLAQNLAWMAFQMGDVAPDQVENLIDRAVLAGKPPVHPGFPESELRVEEEAPMERAVVQAYGSGRSGRTLEDMRLPGGIDQLQPANLDGLLQYPGKQHPA